VSEALDEDRALARPPRQSRVSARKGEKIASIIARDIVRDIVARDLEPGSPLDLESQMLEHYDVSRASLREALRILEIQGIIVIKPGPGGGPFVADVDSRDFGRMSTMFFQVLRVNFGAVLEARLILEPVMASLAAQRGDKKLNQELLEIVGGHEAAPDDEAWWKATQDFHSTVCRMSGNPLLNLLAGSLKNIYAERVGGDVIPRNERPALTDVHRRIAEAISHGDTDTAQRLMHDHMQELATGAEQRDPGLMQEIVDWR
jgi:GntR family transcriptional regulator, transcriptional repressor for pyruvate dehydrogenase complex